MTPIGWLLSLSLFPSWSQTIRPDLWGWTFCLRSYKFVLRRFSFHHVFIFSFKGRSYLPGFEGGKAQFVYFSNSRAGAELAFCAYKSEKAQISKLLGQMYMPGLIPTWKVYSDGSKYFVKHRRIKGTVRKVVGSTPSRVIPTIPK